MDRVVERIDLIDAAADRDRDARLDALIGFRGVGRTPAAPTAGSNTNLSVLRDEDRLRLDAVLAGHDRERGIHDGDKALVRVCAVVRSDAVASCRDADRCAGELDGVFAVEADVLGVHRQILRGDDKIVPGDHGVLIIAADRQPAGAVDREVVFAEHCGVQRRVAVGERIVRSIGDRIDCARSGREKDLVRTAHIDRGAAVVGDRSVFQHELDLVLLAGLDHDHTLIFSGQDIHAGLRDRQIAVRRQRRRFGTVVLPRGVTIAHRCVYRRL